LRQAELVKPRRRAEIRINQVMARCQVQAAPDASGKVNVPQLLEISAEVAALALQEEVDAVARKHLGDLACAEINDPPRPRGTGPHSGAQPYNPAQRHDQ
jgi:hypothetical protein